MTREIDNAPLMHGGTDEIDIPGAALQKIISDALKPDCDDPIESLRTENASLKLQVAELEERNNALANDRDHYKQRCRECEDRHLGKVYE